MDVIAGRRELLFGGALFAALGAGAAVRPRRMAPPLLPDTLARGVPLRIAGYRFAGSSGLVLPDEDRGGIYDQVLTRIYVAPSVPPMMLLVAYGSRQDGGLALHRPEVCYPAAGYRLLDREAVPFPAGTATLLTASKAGEAEQIYYWSRIGSAFPASRAQEKWAVISANLRGTLPDGVLVRLSVRSNDRVAALAQMAAFDCAMLASLRPAARALLLGAGR